ncbi:MAG: molybdenum cofactor guanylyltransferase [Proteobacteria bacterium]|nr:molybdenum cofactor guanylyltransferase [Pseudomonadota bacterium]
MDPEDESRAVCAGAVLAGGRNRRMGGENKALCRVGEKAMVRRVLEVLSACFSEVLVIARAPLPLLDLPAAILPDLLPGSGSLVGIHAALSYARAPYVFVAACDTPFLSPALVRRLAGLANGKVDVVVPRTEKGLEPLCAVYSRRAAPLVRARLLQGRYRISELYGNLKVREVGPDELSQADPGLLSFMNVNTPQDLERARRLGAREEPWES